VKVALVCDWFAPRRGGLELHLQDLAHRLSGAGHDVVVITPTPGDDLVDGIRVRRVHASRAPAFGFVWTRRGVRDVAQALIDERADVAHCHVSIVSPAAIAGARAATSHRIPLVVSFHSIVPRTHVLATFARYVLDADKWNASYTAVSTRVSRDVQPFAPARTVRVLPNGIDADFWRIPTPTPPAHEDRPLRLVSVMRLNAKKRPFALLRILRCLDELLPANHATLCIVGDGPLRRRLERAVDRSRFRDRVTLEGFASRARIREIFAESDAFILPTVRESFGLAALEARCAGLPVIAVSSSGVAEVIRHDVEGLLADSDEGLARNIALLTNNRGRLRAIAEHNRATPTAFDWPCVLEAHVDCYREAIASRENALAESTR
jgi:glycosyltransferase involved in cell wall biosynthesis